MMKCVGVSLEKESYPSPHLLPGTLEQRILQCVDDASHLGVPGHAVISYFPVLEINRALGKGMGKLAFFSFRMQFGISTGECNDQDPAKELLPALVFRLECLHLKAE